jgi:BolA protein
MPVQAALQQKLKQQFSPVFLDVVNESHMHSVPPNSETHFKVVIVSDAFEGKRSVARHQMIYKTLQEEVAGPVHALAIHTYTGAEWAQMNAQSPDSPQCLGGSKADK